MHIIPPNLLEVMRATHAEARDGFAVGIRLSADLNVGGVGPAENIEVAQALQAEGITDFVNVSLGNYQTFAKFIGGMHDCFFKLCIHALVKGLLAVLHEEG